MKHSFSRPMGPNFILLYPRVRTDLVKERYPSVEGPLRFCHFPLTSGERRHARHDLAVQGLHN